MDTTNNFKQLAAEDEVQTPHAPKHVEQEVMGTIKSGHLMGDVLELYFSKMIDLILLIFGGKNKIDPPKDASNDNVGEAR